MGSSRKAQLFMPLSEPESTVAFLEGVMHHRKCLPSQLAKHLGVSHATVSRWLSGADIPNISSCQKIAKYSGTPLRKVLSIVFHLAINEDEKPDNLPEFHEYVLRKYPNQIDEDLTILLEELIERRRERDSRRQA